MANEPHPELTSRETRVVALLRAHNGAGVTYREIYDSAGWCAGKYVGYGVEGHREATRQTICRIRRKYREVDPKFFAIQNVLDIGYRWVGP